MFINKNLIKYWFVFLFQTFFQLTFAQKSVIFEGQIDYPGLTKIDVLAPVKNCTTNEFPTLLSIPKDSNNHFSGQLKLDFPTTIFLRCKSTSHEIYVTPGDTILFNIVKLQKPDTASSLLKNDVYNEALLFKDPSIKYIFFDSLRERFGTLNDIPFKFDFRNQSVEEFIAVNKLNYRERIAFYFKLAARAQVPDDFRKIVFSELKGAYFENLIKYYLITGLDRQKVPADYFDEIFHDGFPAKECLRARHYMAAAHNFITYVLVTDPIGESTNEKLTEQLSSIKTNILDTATANYLSTSAVIGYLDKPDVNLSILDTYFLNCSNKNYVDYVKRLVSAQNTLIESGVPDNVLKLLVLNLQNKKIMLSEVLSKDKPTVIDFWASWCKPCLKEKPVFRQESKKYKHRVNFLSISLDFSKDNWKKGLMRFGSGDEEYYLTDKNIRSLTDFFKISEIPRYVLVSPNGKKILNFRMVSPLDKDQFEKSINDSILSTQQR